MPIGCGQLSKDEADCVMAHRNPRRRRSPDTVTGPSAAEFCAKHRLATADASLYATALARGAGLCILDLLFSKLLLSGEFREVPAMADHRSIAELKELGSDRPVPEEIVSLYRRSFVDFGSRALWSSRPVARPTVAAALSITESLRVEGDLDARRLAERIDEACRAAL
jgi:hypothetical protein